ncbi:MAG: squalene/phytoene synthase family protein [Terasakiella sp.]|uniref:squalene/phytoene synthase family protein n=1 Tax=unclassified Terasakiella TaxID=2614952 RepID=UPI003AFFB2FC
MTRPSSTDFEYVENVVREAKSSFAMGMKALPKDRRGYLFAIYAYCRILDDIADNALPREEKLKQLNEWRIKVTQLIDGKPSCAITRILYEAINRFKIPQDELYQLIEGMEADVRGPIYAPCWDDLYDYCRKVAVSVGLLSLPIFGRKDQGAQDFALELGYALQFTNILRDVAEDDQVGRLYLPQESLQKHNVNGIASQNLNLVLGDVAEKTEHHYKNAEKLLKQIGSANLKPALLMKDAYKKIFRKMQRRGWRKITPRMGLSKTEKAFLVMEFLTRHG